MHMLLKDWTESHYIVDAVDKWKGLNKVVYLFICQVIYYACSISSEATTKFRNSVELSWNHVVDYTFI